MDCHNGSSYVHFVFKIELHYSVFCLKNTKTQEMTAVIPVTMYSLYLHCESKKLGHFYFHCNFVKCWPILTIFVAS